MPSATPTPEAAPAGETGQSTETASPAGAATRYYVMEKNGRKGVVDSAGSVILPFRFSRVDVLQWYEKSDDGKENPTAFFAVPADTPSDGTFGGSLPGCLFSPSGEILMEERVISPYPICAGLLKATADRETGGRVCGALSFTGETVIPFHYEELFAFSGGIAAIYGAGDVKAGTVDIYDESGALLRTGRADARWETGGFIMAAAQDNPNLFGLMDGGFRWVIPAQWDWIYAAGPDRFIVSSLDRFGVTDAEGRPVLEPLYAGIEAQADASGNGKLYFTAYTSTGVHLFDGDGQLLFQSADYQYIRYLDGMLFLTDRDNRMHVTDLAGKELIAPAAYVNWYPDYGLFESVDVATGRNAFSTRDGKRLPLPDADYAQCINRDRFLLMQEKPDGTRSGLFDGEGNVILPVEYNYIQAINGTDRVIVSQVDGRGRYRCGLMDLNGRVLLNVLYDSLYCEGGDGLLHAAVGPVQGLIDERGNWIWYTSVFEGLSD